MVYYSTMQIGAKFDIEDHSKSFVAQNIDSLSTTFLTINGIRLVGFIRSVCYFALVGSLSSCDIASEFGIIS
jgi:hypothetical protein